MYYYKAYGLAIASQVELPLELVVEPLQIDATIEICDHIQQDSFHRTYDGVGYAFDDNSAYLQWDVIGSYRIKNGSEILFSPKYDTFQDKLYSVSLLNTVMAVLLFQRGRIVLHGSGVSIDDKAVVFVGGKGAGKSTLATYLNDAGYPLLSDDVCSVAVNNKKKYELAPSFPQVKLWGDAMEYFNLNPLKYNKANNYSEKYLVVSGLNFMDSPVELGAIVVLTFGDNVGVKRLSGYQGLKALLPHCMLNRFFYRQPQALTKRIYLQMTTLLQQVPVFQLVRPEKLQALPDVVADLECLRNS